MQKLLIICSIILIMGCAANKPSIVVPDVEKFCPRPVRPYIEAKTKWTMQELFQENLAIIDYVLKLEETVDCWEDKKSDK